MRADEVFVCGRVQPFAILQSANGLADLAGGIVWTRETRAAEIDAEAAKAAGRIVGQQSSRSNRWLEGRNGCGELIRWRGEAGVHREDAGGRGYPLETETLKHALAGHIRLPLKAAQGIPIARNTLCREQRKPGHPWPTNFGFQIHFSERGEFSKSFTDDVDFGKKSKRLQRSEKNGQKCPGYSIHSSQITFRRVAGGRWHV